MRYEVTRVERRKLKQVEVLTVDVRVSERGGVWFDDRINMPNPRKDVFGQIKDTVWASTKGFTKKHIKRVGDSNLFTGDTLSVRAGTGDGFLDSSDSSTWSVIQAGNTLLVDTSTGLPATPLLSASNLGGDYNIRVYYAAFDTSSIADTATIDDYTFTMYGTGTAEQNTNTTTLECRAKTFGTLTTADWVDFTTAANWTGLPLMASMAVSTWNQTDGAANALTSQGAESSINLTGSTEVAFALARAYGAEPTGANRISSYTADNTGTSSDPLLVVNYTVVTTFTGTMAGTLQEPTFSGTGAQAQSGTIAGTLQKALFSGVGGQGDFIGSIASILQAATFSGSGSQLMASGTIAATMRAATFSGNGTLPVESPNSQFAPMYTADALYRPIEVIGARSAPVDVSEARYD